GNGQRKIRSRAAGLARVSGGEEGRIGFAYAPCTPAGSSERAGTAVGTSFVTSDGETTCPAWQARNLPYGRRTAVPRGRHEGHPRYPEFCPMSPVRRRLSYLLIAVTLVAVVVAIALLDRRGGAEAH